MIVSPRADSIKNYDNILFWNLYILLMLSNNNVMQYVGNLMDQNYI